MWLQYRVSNRVSCYWQLSVKVLMVHFICNSVKCATLQKSKPSFISNFLLLFLHLSLALSFQTPNYRIFSFFACIKMVAVNVSRQKPDFDFFSINRGELLSGNSVTASKTCHLHLPRKFTRIQTPVSIRNRRKLINKRLM